MNKYLPFFILLIFGLACRPDNFHPVVQEEKETASDVLSVAVTVTDKIEHEISQNKIMRVDAFKNQTQMEVSGNTMYLKTSVEKEFIKENKYPRFTHILYVRRGGPLSKTYDTYRTEQIGLEDEKVELTEGGNYIIHGEKNIENIDSENLIMLAMTITSIQ